MCSQELPFLFVILSGFYSKLGLKVAKIMILCSKFGQFWKSTRWWEMVHQNLDLSSTRYLYSNSEKIQTASGGPSFRIWWPLSWPLAFIWCRKIFLRINLNTGVTYTAKTFCVGKLKIRPWSDKSRQNKTGWCFYYTR